MANSGEQTSSNLIDWEAVRRKCGDDEEMLCDLLQTFLGEAEDRLKLLRDAIAQDQAKDVQLQVHSLKSSLGFLGQTESVVIAEKMETIGRKTHESRKSGKAAQLDNIESLFSDFQPRLEAVFVCCRSYLEKHA